MTDWSECLLDARDHLRMAEAAATKKDWEQAAIYAGQVAWYAGQMRLWCMARHLEEEPA